MKMIKMPGHEYAQCRIREYRKTDGDTCNCDILQSYSTDVLVFDYDSGWLYCNGLYSRTTISHIGWYMRLKCSNYYNAKICATDGVCYNMYTGEFDKVENHKEIVEVS